MRFLVFLYRVLFLYFFSFLHGLWMAQCLLSHKVSNKLFLFFSFSFYLIVSERNCRHKKLVLILKIVAALYFVV